MSDFVVLSSVDYGAQYSFTAICYKQVALSENGRAQYHLTANFYKQVAPYGAQYNYTAICYKQVAFPKTEGLYTKTVKRIV